MPPPRPKRPAARPRLVVAPEPRGPSSAPEVPWDRNEETPVVEDPRALLGLVPEPPAPPPPPPRSPRASAGRESEPPRPGSGKRPTSRPPQGADPATRRDEGQRADPADSPAFLFVEKGPGAGQLVPVRQGTLVIGRGSTSDLRLVHPSISRKHAAVTREGPQFFIRDFGSQNGTFVNQRRCPPELELFPGDEIALGNAVLRLRSRADRDDAPRGRRGAAGASGGDVRSSRSLRWMVLVAATSVGLVGALGWALLHQPEIGPIMEPVPAAAPPASEANGSGAPPSRMEREDRRLAARAAPPAPPVESPTLGKAPSAAERAAPPPASALLEREAIAAGGAAASPREERVPRRAEASAPPTAPRPSPAIRSQPPAPKEPRRTRSPAAEAEPPPQPSGATVAAARQGTSPERTPPASSPPAVSRPSSGPPPPAILAAYEAGDVAGALGRARSAGHLELAGRLERFQQAYEGGKQALAKKDGNGAIRQFVLAAKLDEGISKGWGVYGPELRSRLTRLYVAAGAQKVRSGDAEGARKAYQAALQYDASNVEARSGLDALGPAGR